MQVNTNIGIIKGKYPSICGALVESITLEQDDFEDLDRLFEYLTLTIATRFPPKGLQLSKQNRNG